MKTRKTDANPSGEICGKIKAEKEARPTIYSEGPSLPSGHWYRQNIYAEPLAASIYAGIMLVGLKKFSKMVWKEIYTYIDRNQCYEYSELSQNQKTCFGEFMQKVLTKILGWGENKEGLDVKVCLIIDGRMEFFDVDIKCSSNSKNKGKKTHLKGQIRKGRPPKISMPDQWQISKECYEKINILISVDTYGNNFSIGILDCGREGFLTEIKKPKEGETIGGPQRDGKRAITPLGRENIVWVLYMQPMDPNPLPERRLQIQDLREQYAKLLGEIMEGETDKENDAYGEGELI